MKDQQDRDVDTIRDIYIGQGITDGGGTILLDKNFKQGGVMEYPVHKIFDVVNYIRKHWPHVAEEADKLTKIKPWEEQ